MMTFISSHDVFITTKKQTIMKTLAKTTLLLIIILLFSCSKDDSSDDTDMDNTELILGDWQLYKIFFNAEDGSTTEMELDACDTLRTFTFNDDFTYLYILRSGDNCETNND